MPVEIPYYFLFQRYKDGICNLVQKIFDWGSVTPLLIVDDKDRNWLLAS